MKNLNKGRSTRIYLDCIISIMTMHNRYELDYGNINVEDDIVMKLGIFVA